MRRRFLLLALLALVVASLLSWSVLRPQIAHARAAASYNCGGTCVGKDPYTYYAGGQRCSDGSYAANSAYTSNDGTFTAQLQNWYSPVCNTNWALVWWTGGNSRIHGVHVTIYCPTTRQVSNEPTEGLDSGQYSPAWTNMIDGTNTTEATTQLFIVQFVSPVYSTSGPVDA